MKILIIGSGFFGAAIFRALRLHGHDVTCWDSGDPRSGSRNAAGIYRLSYLKHGKWTPQWWTNRHTHRSVSYLASLGGELAPTDFKNVRESVWDDTYILPDIELARLGADAIPRSVVRVTREGSVFTSDGREDFDCIVLAAGYKTDDILKESRLTPVGVVPLGGRAVIYKGTVPNPGRLFTRQIRPYVQFTARAWPGGCFRVGDTVEGKSDGTLEPLHEIARSLNSQSGVGVTVHGYRAKSVSGQPVVETRGKIIVASGGGRIGLMLAGGVALRVQEIVGG